MWYSKCMTDTQTTADEVVSAFVTQHAPTMGAREALRLARAAARIQRETDEQRDLRLLTQIFS